MSMLKYKGYHDCYYTTINFLFKYLDALCCNVNILFVCCLYLWHHTTNVVASSGQLRSIMTNYIIH